MTFAEFRATGRDEPDLASTFPNEDFPPGTQGRIYLKNLFLEDSSTWPSKGTRIRGRWYTLIGCSEYQSDVLEEIERTLYRFAVREGYITPDPDDPITDEPEA